MSFTIGCASPSQTARNGFLVLAVFASITAITLVNSALAGVAFNYSGATIGGGSRWDAAPRTINLSGTNYERSLNGGLRYSLQGGSFQAYRDLFSWNVVPSITDFQTAVQQAFNAWTIADPVSGLGTTLSFAPDLTTPVIGSNTGSGGVDSRGAEIDLFGSTNAGFWDVGNTGTQGETRFNAIGANVTLTSGTANYAGSSAISGADIILNSNPGAVYSLDFFRRLLTHEIGHAIGFGDVEGNLSAGAFVDDNFDGTSPATALATLNNNWALMVNPLNPGASIGLSRYTIPFSNPGTTTPGVNILMESNGLGIGAGNLVTNLTPLSNDDYSMRQFLYPVVPEPTALALVFTAILGLALRRVRQSV